MSNVVLDFIVAQERLEDRADEVMKIAYPEFKYSGFIYAPHLTIQFLADTGAIQRVHFEADSYQELDYSCTLMIEQSVLIDNDPKYHDPRIEIVDNVNKLPVILK
jgi:hypothetical protein